MLERHDIRPLSGAGSKHISKGEVHQFIFYVTNEPGVKSKVEPRLEKAMRTCEGLKSDRSIAAHQCI
jgi:hypothetical protein